MVMAKAHVVKFPFALKFKHCHACGKQFNVENSFTEQTPVPIAKAVSRKCFISRFNKFNDDMPIVSGEIPYHKARALLPLVSNVSTTVETSVSGKYFFELQRSK